MARCDWAGGYVEVSEILFSIGRMSGIQKNKPSILTVGQSSEK